jgi:hypothetical protein
MYRKVLKYKCLHIMERVKGIEPSSQVNLCVR